MGYRKPAHSTGMRWTVVIAALCFFGAPGARAQVPSVPQIVQGISQSTYTSYLRDYLYTHNGDNRGYGTQHDLARGNIFSLFQSFGLSTSLHSFVYNGTTYYNVIGVLQGTTRPTEYLLLGAHYDSANNPGADDNGSGVAGVLETARVLSEYTFERTIIFAAFDREEQGLRGSNAWASEHAAWDIQGMVSLDMIAYNPAGSDSDKARIYGRTSSNPLKQALSSAVSTYGGIACTMLGQWDVSDHAPFEWQGFEAALLIEYNALSNPHYHKATDSVDTAGYIDYDYATRMTKGSAAWLAGSAGPVGWRNGSPVPEFGTFHALAPGAGYLLVILLGRRSRRPSASARGSAGRQSSRNRKP